MQRPSFRTLSWVMGAALLILTVTFFTQMSWATGLLPWEEKRLTNIFFASIWAAIACPVLWIGWTGELGAMVGGGLNLMLTNLGVTIFLVQSYTDDTDNERLLISAIAFAVFFLMNLGFVYWGLKAPIRDPRPLPQPVRLSFAVFAGTLILVGGGLILKVENIFPWPFVHIETSVLVGWIFLGAAVYFIYALLRPSWHNAAGQLIGFLAYDLVLIVPFIRHFADVRDDLRDSLIIYTAVVVYSGLLAIYYLFIHKGTRISVG